MQAEDQKFQYLPEEERSLTDQTPTGEAARRAAAAASQVKETAAAATGQVANRVREVLPDGQQMREAVDGAIDRVAGSLPDPTTVKAEFIGAAERLAGILPDGDDLKELVTKVAQEVRDDPDIRRHVEAAAEVVSQRVQGTVGQGIDTAAGKVRQQVEKAGLEDLGYVADRVGEIVKEGVGELVEETRSRALDALPDPAPYQPQVRQQSRA